MSGNYICINNYDRQSTQYTYFVVHHATNNLFANVKDLKIAHTQARITKQTTYVDRNSPTLTPSRPSSLFETTSRSQETFEISSVFIRFSSIIHKLRVVEDISGSLLRVTAIPIDQRGRMEGRRFRAGSGIWMRITEQRVNLRSGSNGFPRISWKREDFFATIVVFASRSFPPSSTYFRGNTAFY